jgi:signal transduction histidine kinase
VVGSWDRGRLEQVVTNLLSNAVKYGDCKPIDLAVEAADDGQARLVVRDHGLGIAAHDQARIFERFERAASSRHFGGIGLGLWIVRQIVIALGGSVSVESELGSGSTFTVTLPRQALAHGQDGEGGQNGHDGPRPSREPVPGAALADGDGGARAKSIRAKSS